MASNVSINAFYSIKFVVCVYMVDEIQHEILFTHNQFNLSNKTFKENYYCDPQL